MSLIHYLTPDVLYCLLLSVCVQMERILFILLETERETDGWTPTFIYLSLQVDFSLTHFTLFPILTMYFLYANYWLEFM